MTLKFVNCKINSVASDINLRVDPKYHIFLNSKSNWNVFENDKKLINLNKIIKEKYKYFDLKNNEEYFGIPTGESYIDQDGLIINHKKVTLEDCPNRIKYEIDKDDIVLSSLRLAKTPSSNFEKRILKATVHAGCFMGSSTEHMRSKVPSILSLPLWSVAASQSVKTSTFILIVFNNFLQFF